MMELLDDEAAYLAESTRCDACGHLQAFHNEHCCSFCMIPKCRCEFDRIPKKAESPR